MKKKLIIILISTAIAGFVVYKLAVNKKEIDKKQQPVSVGRVQIPVTVASASEGIQEAGFVKAGTLAPLREAKVFSVSSGNILRLLFQPGDNVRKGQTLAIIDSRLLQLDLEKSVFNVSKLKYDLQTYTELLEGNATTREQVDDIRQSYTEAVNLSQQLRRQITDADIKAPTDGMIASKAVEEGMFVGIGTELASIVDLSQLKVRIYLTEAEVYQVETGQTVRLTTEVYPGRSFSGTVTFISPQANQAHNYQVEVTVANSGDVILRSGTFVYADFSRKTTQKLLVIPRGALIASTQDASVYLVADGKAVLRTISVGGEYGNSIHVTGGLQAGDQVITSGQINLKDGALIRISK